MHLSLSRSLLLALSTIPATTAIADVLSHLYVVILHANITGPDLRQHVQTVQKLTAEGNRLGKRSGEISSFEGVKFHFESVQAYSAHLPDTIAANLRASKEVLMIQQDSTVQHCQEGVISTSMLTNRMESSVQSRSLLPRSSNRPGSLTAHPTRPTPRPGVVPSSSVARQRAQQAARPGLVRISHLNNDGQASDYVYRNTAGAPATIYSFDSGVRLTHSEFEGRVASGVDFTSSISGRDLNGHGTHVMAIALGKTYGVAKQARGISVKTLDMKGAGKVSVIIQGIDWVLRQSTVPNNLKVINLSFAGVYNAALNHVVEQAIAAGCHVVVAAGNEATDALNFSPASSSAVLTIGAIDKFDQATNYTNHGKSLDFVAPGNAVLSAWYRDDFDSHLDTGTSMAAPHVTGLIAYILGLNGAMSPARMRNELIRLSRTTATAFPFGTIPRIIYNGSGK